jgi:hypothetical protein
MDIDLSQAVWQKSTSSNGQGGACVEIAINIPGVIAMRDSKDPDGPKLVFTPAEWAAFVAGVRDGEFDG